MKRTVSPLARRIVACLTALFFISSSFAQGGFSAATNQRLQHVIDSFITQSSPAFVGGMSIAINVDGVTVWQKAAGYAARNMDAQNNLLSGGTPFETSTLSRAFSITKTFMAPLVLQLVQEGYLSLDDRISKYMPYMGFYTDKLSPNVTIRQLLNHESGYQDWEDNIDLQMAIAFDPTHKWSAYELMHYTEQLTPPGTRREYSHNNYVFLGAIVEAATGWKVDSLFRARFFKPLGLQSIYFEGRETHGVQTGTLAAPHDNISPFNPIFYYTQQPTYPEGYTNISRFPYSAIVSLGFTGGAVVSNAYDISVWGNALYGGRITSPEVLNAMMESISDTADSYGNKLGYGVKLYNKFSGKYDFIGHNGSAPGYRSGMYYHPDKKMTIVVLSNFAGADQYVITRELYKVLPEFQAGNENRKEDKIILCHNGKTITVAREAAAVLIKNGATLGACEEGKDKKNDGKKPIDVLSAYPNPASGNVTVSFTPLAAGRAILTLHNANGVLVSTLFNGMAEKGMMKQVTLSADKLMPGTYYCRLQTTTGSSEQKLLIVR